MCRHCKDVENVHERVANHDFMEQMREFYGQGPRPVKDRRIKNVKKSVLAKIEYQLTQVCQKVGYGSFEERLNELLSAPFDETQTPQKFEDIMNEIHAAQMSEVLNYLRSEG